MNWYDYMNGVILLFLTAIDKLVKMLIVLRSNLTGIHLGYSGQAKSCLLPHKVR